MDLTEHDAEFVLRNILDGIKDIEGLKFDTDTAEHLHASKERINQWKNRKTIPYADALLYAKNKAVSLSWLLLRQGEKFLGDGVHQPIKGQYAAAEGGSGYEIAEPWNMDRFNKCLAIMNEEAERRDLHLDAAALLKATAVLYQQTKQEPDMQLVKGLLELAG